MSRSTPPCKLAALLAAAACAQAPLGSHDAASAATEDRPRNAVTDASVRVDAPLPALPSLPAPSAFGDGFRDITGPVVDDAPFRLPKPRREMGPNDDVFALVADVDHDGVDEVVFSHAVGDRPLARPPPAAYAVYRYDRAARRLVRARDVALPDMPPLAGVLDLDGDGVADLLALDRVSTLAWGRGGGRYDAAVALAEGISDWGNSGNLTGFFPDDLDDDGWLDLLVSSDCCRAPCVDFHTYLRTAPRRFQERPDLIMRESPGRPYTVFAARFATGERLAMSVGWSCSDPMGSPVFYRQTQASGAGFARLEPWDPTPDDSSFRPSPGRYPTLASLSPMAAVAEDLDGDGRNDLVVSLNPNHLVLRGGDAWPFTDESRRTGIETTAAPSGRAMIPWGVAALDLDRDGRLDLVFAHGNDQGAWFDVPERLIGPQRTAAYWSRGAMRYEEIPGSLGLGRLGHFRAVTPADLDGDGDPDLTIGGQLELARVYRNDIDNGNGALALRLHGTSSNHLAVGAQVAAWVDEAGPPLRRYVGGTANPYNVSAPWTFFGLGRASRVSRLEVTWPSGYVQTLRDLTAGRVVDVVEPELFTLAPSSRRRPSGPGSTFEMRVLPRRGDGALDPDAAVEVALLRDGAREVVPARRVSEGWVATIPASTAPATARVEVLVRGAPLRVRPRLWWD